MQEYGPSTLTPFKEPLSHVYYTQFYLGKTPTTLKFDPNPEAKRHRILRSKQVKSVRLENGDKVTLSNNEIKELMNEYGKENGILPMKLIDLVKRE